MSLRGTKQSHRQGNDYAYDEIATLRSQ